MDQLTLPGTAPCGLLTVDVYLHADGGAHASIAAHTPAGGLLANLSTPYRAQPELALDDAVKMLRETFLEVVAPF